MRASFVLVYALPWLIVITYGAISATLDYEKFKRNKDAELDALQKATEQLSENIDALSRQLKIVLEQFQDIKEEKSIHDGISAMNYEVTVFRTKTNGIQIIFFPNSLDLLKSSLRHFEEVTSILETSFEVKRELLEVSERLRGLSQQFVIPFGTRNFFFGIDLSDFLNIQHQLAQKDAERLKLEEKARSLRSTLNLLGDEAEAKLDILRSLESEINRSITSEAQISYTEVLSSRIKGFNLRKKLASLFNK